MQTSNPTALHRNAAWLGLSILDRAAADIGAGRVNRAMDDLYTGQRALAAKALSETGRAVSNLTRDDGSQAAKQWRNANRDALARTKGFLAELERSGELTVAKLTLANSQIHALGMQ